MDHQKGKYKEKAKLKSLIDKKIIFDDTHWVEVGTEVFYSKKLEGI